MSNGRTPLLTLLQKKINEDGNHTIGIIRNLRVVYTRILDVILKRNRLKEPQDNSTKQLPGNIVADCRNSMYR